MQTGLLDDGSLLDRDRGERSGHPWPLLVLPPGTGLKGMADGCNRNEDRKKTSRAMSHLWFCKGQGTRVEFSASKLSDMWSSGNLKWHTRQNALPCILQIPWVFQFATSFFMFHPLLFAVLFMLLFPGFPHAFWATLNAGAIIDASHPTNGPNAVQEHLPAGPKNQKPHAASALILLHTIYRRENLEFEFF